MRQDKQIGLMELGERKSDNAQRLSVITLFVKLMIDPVYKRRRWEMRNFRCRFFFAYVVCISRCHLPLSAGIV
ncbi:Uncharacterised protein [Escherichia coli]|nr:Uncharacterised protein [Escherichia coli]